VGGGVGSGVLRAPAGEGEGVDVGGAGVEVVEVGAGRVLDAGEDVEGGVAARGVLARDWADLERVVAKTCSVM